MKHQVTYKNAPSDWNEALPLGNSVFGGMTYFKKNQLTFAMNHYEVYYKKHHKYSQKYREMRNENNIKCGDGSRYEKLVDLANSHYSNYKEEAVYSYFETLFKHSDTYGHGLRGVSHMPTGEMIFNLSETIKEECDYTLRLLVEEAKAALKVTKQDEKINIDTIVAQGSDHILFEVNQTKVGLLESLTLTYPKRRYQKEFISAFHQLDEDKFYYTVSFYPDGEDTDKYEAFQFIVMVGLEGAKGIATVNSKEEMHIKLYDANKQITVITHVLTQEQSKELLAQATKNVTKALSEKGELKKEHQRYWGHFFNQSRVSLPDKFLENLWYINLYALGCCSGRGGKMYPDASGLNGLWDIKQPNIWGSSWYWDVNIQATYWPVYTANHLELSEVFIEGLLFYTWDMQRLAKEGYGAPGYAMDYPHMLYNSVLPWCAQWLWWHYEYGGDKTFLREKAYPFFKNLLKFIAHIIRWDEEQGAYYFYPEVSPEQGPLTRNATITLATVKYLIQIALETVEILGIEDEDEKTWRRILNGLPDYPTGIHPKEGAVIRDSEYAMPDLHLRHPSLLMPIYPIGEINQYSKEPLQEMAKNTLRYVEKESEIGVFIFGWIACAAARMGDGDRALRALYQRGIDYMLRANGLCAEETERWNNFCTIGRSPLYYPCIMEATGEIVATVNEMLLQSYDGVIDVFPALPKGVVEKEQLLGVHQHNIQNQTLHYGRWDDCSFSKFLAKGGFEISSKVSGGEIKYIHIRSLRGGRAKLRVKELLSGMSLYDVTKEGWVDIAYEEQGTIVTFDTYQDGGYVWAKKENIEEWIDVKPWVNQDQETEDEEVIYTHQAHTYRRVFVGKDKSTEYTKALDGMTFEYCLGNVKRSMTSAYRFDFGCGETKDYKETLHRQVYEAGKIGLGFQNVTPDNEFTVYEGYGFKQKGELVAKNRNLLDQLRTDFIEGTQEATFWIEVTKGRYDLFVVCGDEAEESYTELTIEENLKVQPQGTLKEGEYLYEIIPLVIKEDKYMEIKINTKQGKKWKINTLIVNKIHSI